MTGHGEGRPLRRHPHVASRVYDGEALVVTPQNSRKHILSDVGTRVWDLIDGEHTLEQIAEIVAKEYEVTLETATGDIRDFIDVLEANGMLADDDAGKVA